VKIVIDIDIAEKGMEGTVTLNSAIPKKFEELSSAGRFTRQNEIMLVAEAMKQSRQLLLDYLPAVADGQFEGTWIIFNKN